MIASISWLGSKLAHAVEQQPAMPIVAVLSSGGRNDCPAFTTGLTSVTVFAASPLTCDASRANVSFKGLATSPRSRFDTCRCQPSWSRSRQLQTAQVVLAHLIEDLKIGAAVDDESSQDNEKHNCGSDRPPIIFRAPWIGPSAIVAARLNHFHARV